METTKLQGELLEHFSAQIPVPPPPRHFVPSIFQLAIFDFVRGVGSAIIEAVAGSGKTTTIVKALALIDAKLSVLFLAFNKSIATELAARVPSHCEALQISTQHGNRIIDFDDMLFLPLINSLVFPQFDVVLVDESQDTNLVQQAILKRVVKPVTGRLIAVGDSNQAIYGFRGADSEAMSRLCEAFNCVTLPLSVCYRSAKSIVAMAQKYVPHIQACDTAPDGKVERLAKYDEKVFRSTDAILCRNTAPLVELAYGLIAKNVGVRILGREIGKGLINLIKKLNANGIESLQTKLEAYEKREVGKLMSKGQDTKAEAVADRVACIGFIIGSLKETERTIPALVRAVEALFTDNGAGLLTLCTVHKSKGLEWERVYILDFDKYMPSKWATRDWQKQQETNLIYVGITRAKLELYFIESGIMNRG